MTRVLRWIAPSVVAACAAALAAGLVTTLPHVRAGFAIAASLGFGAIAIGPLVLALDLALRGLAHAWQPRALIAALDGPALAAWICVAWLGLAWLAWTGFQGTWMLANWTASFKALPVALGMALLAAGAALLGVLCVRPVARGLAFVFRKIDRRIVRLTPLRIAIAAGVLLVGDGVGVYLYARHRLGAIDPIAIAGPAAALAAVIAVHAMRRVRFAAALGGLVVVVVGAAVASAIVAAARAPSLALAIWGDHPITGIAIARVFDLEAIRARVPVSDFATPPLPGGAAHRDILLVTIDTLRADRTPLSVGGKPDQPAKADMPGLRALGARGYTFDWAFSPANTAARALPAIEIGVAPDRVRARDPRHIMLAERMAAAGYETAAFVPEPLAGSLAPARGFARVETIASGKLLAERARVFVTERERGAATPPLFVWLRLAEPRDWASSSPTEPHTEDERRAAYDRALHVADAALGDVLAGFADRPADRAPIVIVAGECGEGLGDHGQPGHGTDVYDAQTHVPLVVAGPGIVVGRSLEATSLVDLVPTIVELAGYVPPHGVDIDGTSFADVATGRRAPAADGGIAFIEMPKDALNPTGVVAVVRGTYKLIEFTNGHELYNVHADPDEKFNLMLQMPKRVGDMKAYLEQRAQRSRTSPFR